jgi:O-succinylbenzoic acid--CoA ligase
MAETLSHIALRRANGPEASNWYSPLPGIHVSLNPEGCLKVEAPMLCQRPVQTHDVAEIDATGRFRILGRLDNLINTGGKKILAETLESLLASYIRQPFAVTSQPDAKLSHRVVLVTEGPFDRSVLSTFKPAWMKPKAYVVVNSLPRTISGKLDRNALHQLVNASGTH